MRSFLAGLIVLILAQDSWSYYLDNENSREDANMYRYPYYGGLKSELTKRLASSVTQDLAKLQTEEVKELEHGSGHWNLAMFKHLLDLKQDGKNSEDLFAAQEMNGHKRVICKMEPYNECYSIDDNGVMHSLGGQQRPVRLLRIY